ncbi:MAG: hypothetical protein V4581_14965 [Bacteroidota bacterium]
MKKLYLTLIALFMLVSAQAQTITEADLLGEWQLKTMQSPGMLYVDFDKDSVAMVQDVKATAQAQEMQKLLIGGLNEEIAKINGKITFYTGSRYALTMRGEDDIKKYSLINLGNSAGLIPENSKDTITLSIIKGVLHYVQQVKGMATTLIFERPAVKAARQAQQPIPEAVLLGGWQPLSITAKGCTYNYKTGAVTLPDNIIAQANKKGEDIPALKAKLADALKSIGFAGVNIFFKQRGIMEWHDKGTIDTSYYTVIKKEGSTYIKRPDGRELKVDFKEGHFKILKPSAKGGPDTEVIFEKIK